jgi:hypothetical protein
MTQTATAARTQTSVSVDIKAVRQKLLDKLDALPQSKWGRGLRLSGGVSGASVIVSRDETRLFVEYRGECVMKVTLNPDKSNRFQSKSSNRRSVEDALQKLNDSHAEVVSMMADW